MSERKRTLMCSFNLRSPKITAFNIHEWIHDKMRVKEDEVSIIQIDGPRCRVYIKFINEDTMHAVYKSVGKQVEYKHENGEISKVNIELAGMGFKRIRIACLPPEVTEHTLKECMSTYGQVQSTRDEMWTQAYRYKVYNGVKIVEMKLKQHIPSHLAIAGKNTTIIYDGQSTTYFRCNEIGHLQSDCPRK